MRRSRRPLAFGLTAIVSLAAACVDRITTVPSILAPETSSRAAAALATDW